MFCLFSSMRKNLATFMFSSKGSGFIIPSGQSTVFWKTSTTCLNIYSLPTKLREGNIVSPVGLSFCSGGLHRALTTPLSYTLVTLTLSYTPTQNVEICIGGSGLGDGDLDGWFTHWYSGSESNQEGKVNILQTYNLPELLQYLTTYSTCSCSFILLGLL